MFCIVLPFRPSSDVEVSQDNQDVTSIHKCYPSSFSSLMCFRGQVAKDSQDEAARSTSCNTASSSEPLMRKRSCNLMEQPSTAPSRDQNVVRIFQACSSTVPVQHGKTLVQQRLRRLCFSKIVIRVFHPMSFATDVALGCSSSVTLAASIAVQRQDLALCF